jgi:DNA-binding HxlR family transcriptional regulator
VRWHGQAKPISDDSAAGLITLQALERVPEHGLRQLTSLGRTLLKPIRGLVNWAGENREKIQAAIERYDAAHSRAVAALGN